MLEDLGAGKVEYESVEEFLIEIKKKFGEEEEKLQKVVELKRMIKEFVQDFKRVVRGSRYEGCPLIEEFK